MFDSIIHKVECLLYGIECLITGTGSYWSARWALEKTADFTLTTAAIVFLALAYRESALRTDVNRLLRKAKRKILRGLRRGFNAFNAEADRQYRKRQLRKVQKARQTLNKARAEGFIK